MRDAKVGKFIPYVVLFITSLLIIFPFVSSATSATSTDFNVHFQYAQDLPDQVRFAHVLFDASVLFYGNLLPEASANSVFVFSMITFMSPTLLLIFALLKRSSNGHIKEPVILFLSVCLSSSSPQ